MPVELYKGEFEEYLRDESRRTGCAGAVALARTVEEVQDALRAAAEKGWAVTVQGARTGIAAGAVPEEGMVLNLSRMKHIGDVHDRSVVVQPGALLSEIRAVVDAAGLFFPPDPTETSASIGGMLACNASGALSYHYGPARKWVYALKVVLADGDVLKIDRSMRADGLRYTLRTESGRVLAGELPALKVPTVKSAAGYFVAPDMELVDLFIGMEGTLGVIVEAELKLIPMPPVRQVLCAFLPDEGRALRFVRAMRGESGPLPCPPVAIEFFDRHALALLRRAASEEAAFSELPVPAAHFDTAVCLEFHGEAAGPVEETVMAAAQCMETLGAKAEECWLADTPQEIEPLKLFRHATPEVVNLLVDRRKKTLPELTKLGTDMSVPDDCLEQVMQMYRNGLSQAGLEHVIFGHIGNNHVHVNILPRSMEEYATGKALILHWADNVVAMGGSISAEHGIGKLKTALLEKMVGNEGIQAMTEIKKQFDPDGVLGPGNLFRVEQSERKR